MGAEKENLGAWVGLRHRLHLVQKSPCVFVPALGSLACRTGQDSQGSEPASGSRGDPRLYLNGETAGLGSQVGES